VITSAKDSDPDVEALKKVMLASLKDGGQSVNLDDIEAVVSFYLKQTFSFGEGVDVTEPVAKDAVAKSFDVPADKVHVVITSKRRLRSGRRLAGTEVAATITVEDSTKADQMNAKAKDTGAIGDTFANNFAVAHKKKTGVEIAVPVITAKTPEMVMDIKYVIKSQSAEAVVVPTAAKLKEKFSEDASLSAISSSLTVATPAPTVAPTPLPEGQTFEPTVAPTFAPETPSPTLLPTPATPPPTNPPAPTNAPAPTAPTPAPAPSTPPTAAPAPKKATESGAPSYSLRLSITAVACAIAIALAAA